jgi:hypothetical protein
LRNEFFTTSERSDDQPKGEANTPDSADGSIGLESSFLIRVIRVSRGFNHTQLIPIDHIRLAAASWEH